MAIIKIIYILKIHFTLEREGKGKQGKGRIGEDRKGVFL
jgi:hypothetical protein